MVDGHRTFGFRARFRDGRSGLGDEAEPRAQRQKQRKLRARERKFRIQGRGLPQQRGRLRQRFFAPALKADDSRSLTEA